MIHKAKLEPTSGSPEFNDELVAVDPIPRADTMALSRSQVHADDLLQMTLLREPGVRR